MGLFFTEDKNIGVDDLLDAASTTEEEGEDDSVLFASAQDGHTPPYQTQPAYEPAPENRQHTQEETRWTEPAQPQPEPVADLSVAEPEPVAVEPVQEAAPPAPGFTSPPPTCSQPEPQQEDSNLGDLVGKVIGTLDAYRALDKEHQGVAAQFICSSNDVNPDDETRVVVSALEADPVMAATMSNLRKVAQETDRVQRAFAILRLPGEELSALVDLVQTLTDQEIQSDDAITCAQSAELVINSMDSKIVDYVAATETVLAKAR